MEDAAAQPDDTARFAEEARAAGLALPSGGRFRTRTVVVAAVVIVALSLTVGYATGWMNLSRSRPSPLALLPGCPPGGITVEVSSEPDLPSSVANAWPSLTSGFSTYTGGCLSVYTLPSGAGFGTLTSLHTDAIVGPELPAPEGKTGLAADTEAVPLVVSPVVVVVNTAGLLPTLSLSASALAGAYLGSVVSWNASALTATNPGLTSDLNLSVVHLAGPSETNALFSTYLAEHDPAFSSSVGTGVNVTFPVGVVATSDAEVTSLVASTPGRVGYEAADVCPSLPAGLVCASLQAGSSSFVAPSRSTVAAAAALEANSSAAVEGNWANASGVAPWNSSVYPVVKTTYALMYRDLGTAYGPQLGLNASKWLVALFFWIASDTTGATSTVATTYGFVVLPTSLAVMAEEADLSVTYLGNWILQPPGAILEGSEGGESGGETGEF